MYVGMEIAELGKGTTTWCCYTLTCPVVGQVRYVGSTSCPQSRYAAHIKSAGNPQENPTKSDWLLSLLEDGLMPVMRVVAVGNQEEMQRQEGELYDELAPHGFLLNCHRPRLKPKQAYDMTQVMAAIRERRASYERMQARHEITPSPTT